MLSRRHIAIGGGTKPTWVVVPTDTGIAFVNRDVTSGELQYLTTDANVLGPDFTDAESIAYMAPVNFNQFTYFGFCQGGATSYGASLEVNNAVSVFTQDQGASFFNTDRVSHGLRSNGTNYIFGADGVRLIRWLGQGKSQALYTTFADTFNFLDLNPSEDLLYVCNRTDDTVDTYNPYGNLVDDPAYFLFEDSFSTAFEMNEPIACLIDSANEVIYVLGSKSAEGKLAAYNIASGSFGTLLDVITLTSWGTDESNPNSSFGIMRFDTTNNLLCITEGRNGDGIHLVDISDTANLTDTRIAGQAAMTGGNMVSKPSSIDFADGFAYIASGEVDTDPGVNALIAVDISTGFTASSTVSSALTGTQMGINNNDNIGLIKAF